MMLPWRTPASLRRQAEPPAENLDGAAPTAPPGTISAKGSAGVGAATMVAALSGLAITWIVARTYAAEPARATEFLMFWAVLFGVYAVLSGIQSETTRAVRSAELSEGPKGFAPASVLKSGLLIGGLAAALILISSPLWAQRLLPSDPITLTIAIALAAFAYSGHTAVLGAAAGGQRWGLYARLLGVEAFSRLVAVAAIVVFGAPRLGFELACIIAAVTWLAFMAVSRQLRGTARAVADAPLPLLLRRSFQAIISAVATAALIVGFPILLSLTTDPTVMATSAGLLLAIQLTRAPIMVPLQAFQGVFIASFVNQRDRGLGALLKPSVVITGIGIVGAGLAWLLGPWLLTLFGPLYQVDGWVLAVLTFDAALMALLTLTGTAALAIGYHRAYATGWVVAAVISTAVLLLPLPIEERAMLSLCCGPLLGSAVHCLAIRRPARRIAAPRGTEPHLQNP